MSTPPPPPTSSSPPTPASIKPTSSTSEPIVEEEDEDEAPLSAHDRTSSEVTLGPNNFSSLQPSPFSPIPPSPSTQTLSQSQLGRGAPPSATKGKGLATKSSQSSIGTTLFTPHRTPPPPPPSAPALTSPGMVSDTPGKKLPGILQKPSLSLGERQSSTTSSLRPDSSVYTQAGGGGGARASGGGIDYDAQSMTSEEADDQSDFGRDSFVGAKLSRGPSATVAAAAKGKGPMGLVRSSSIQGRSKSRARGRSASRVRPADDDDDDDDDPVLRPMSPGPPMLQGRDFPGGDDDDEVERRDRGEELVRKRAKERNRLKKEAEKATRKREQDARVARGQPEAVRRVSVGGLPKDYERDLSLDRSVSGPGALPSLSRAITGESIDFRPSQARSRDPSISRTRDSLVASGSEDYASSDAGTERGPPGSPFAFPSSPGADPWSASSPMFPGRQLPSRGTSYAPSSRAGDDPFSDRRSAAGDIVDEPAEESPAEYQEDDQYDGHGDDDDDEEEDDGEVEYTLKDRQDAINIEHPFGLPIWKPALYKKSRSVTRNAETALHATPSSVALRHLAPGNILWTVFFGSWLFLICAVVSAILWCVPWGGEKYGRVIWELGGYLLWPFGKYVEGWSDKDDGSDEEGSENDDDNVLDEEDEDEGEDAEAEESASTPSTMRRYSDVEGAGRTFGRGRARTVSSRGGSTHAARLDSFFDDSDTSVLPDEPRRIPIADEDGVATPVAGRTLKGPSAQAADTTEASERTALLEQTRTATALSGTTLGGSTNSKLPSSQSTLVGNGSRGYGTGKDDKATRSPSEDTIGGTRRPHDFSKDDDHSFRVRALGRSMYWIGVYLIVAPLMLLVCILCWAMVFTIPMAKLLWVLLRHLSNEPLALHFRSPPKYSALSGSNSTTSLQDGVQYPLRAGQRAPRVSRKSVAAAKAHGRLFGPRSTVLLCTYRATGWQYYKYTIDGVNILFINLLSLVFFVIADFWFIAPKVEEHEIGGFLGLIGGQAFIFVIALLSVIPLSYFIGMAVASISAQSSIGMGAVINASFGSIIEIILYCIALTQSKGELVEGSIVGSLLAGVLLMPGLSMIGGAMRRKEQRFNAKSAGVTSTMLIMAIIGILTPTLFYEIYGSFQLTCSNCDPTGDGTTTSCKTCYYEHVDPVDDPFYKTSVRLLSYWCAVLLVLSYLIGLWFSLRTHASQIWQNAQPSANEQGIARPVSGVPDRTSLYKRVIPSQLIPHKRQPSHPGAATPGPTVMHPDSSKDAAIPGIQLPEGMSVEEFSRAFQAVSATVDVMQRAAPQRQSSHAREISGGATKEHEAEGHGGHDAPNWSRLKSASVLMSCTVLYAIIAEILVDVVDVVLDGSGIPEKFLGVTLFALVPNTTEFMNAISFAINGNIALSMEIGSAYALQVCLIQAPIMLAFSAYYSIGKDYLNHRAFTLVFPRWDVISIMFSVFLLTYTYIEARANYYRGSILCLSYLVLLGGFAFSPGGEGTVDKPDFVHSLGVIGVPTLTLWHQAKAVVLSLFTR